MEIEKAIGRLKINNKSLKSLLSEDKSDKDLLEKIEANNLAIAALEKQVGKKVIKESWSPAKCPTCGTYLSENMGDGYYKDFEYLGRCPNDECAQKLDWSDEQ